MKTTCISGIILCCQLRFVEFILKIIFTIVLSILFFTLQAPAVWAGDWKEDQAKADQYYEAENYSRAFKTYFKLAKMGVSHSQDRVSTMYANGEGKKMDLTEAC